jgi:hypothetical protein
MSAMKRSERWTRDSEAGASNRKAPPGPLQRRRAQRHLDSLAQHPTPDLSPTVAVAHVRVIGESTEPTEPTEPTEFTGSTESTGVPDGMSRRSRIPNTGHDVESLAISAPPGVEVRIVSHQLGAQLRAVPIDEPLASSL